MSNLNIKFKELTKYNEDISKYFDRERPDDTQYSYADDNWTPSLREAKKILKANGYYLNESAEKMLDGNDWYKELISELNSEKEYRFVDSCFDDDYKEFILDGDFIYWNDNWQCYADKDGYGSDDLYEIAPLENYNYDDLVAEFGTPSEYVKKCLKYMK